MPSQRKYTFFALLAVTISLMALYIQRHRHGQTGKIDNFLISVSGALQSHFSYFNQGTRTIGDHYLFLVNTKKHNEDLERELYYLKTKLAALSEVEFENSRLREALQFRAHLDERLFAAHVVAHDVSTDYLGIRIDKGSEDGVQAGLGVISPNGLVGRIQRVTPHYSDVMTLVDPTSNVDVVIQRSRARGILSGQAKQLTCRLKYLDRLEDVTVNDTVVSSGFGNIFPKGLLVGYVTAVIPNSTNILQTVTVKSAVDIYRLEEVFIVFPAESAKTAK